MEGEDGFEVGEDGDAVERRACNVVVDLVANLARQGEKEGLWL